MKKKFKEPYINVYHFKMENIVTTSSGYTGTKLDSEDALFHQKRLWQLGATLFPPGVLPEIWDYTQICGKHHTLAGSWRS